MSDKKKDDARHLRQGIIIGLLINSVAFFILWADASVHTLSNVLGAAAIGLSQVLLIVVVALAGYFGKSMARANGIMIVTAVSILVTLGYCFSL